MLDLFCGRFGWSKAFAACGWECVGVDLVEPPKIPQGCTFIKADILQMEFREGVGIHIPYVPYAELDAGNFDFICASSPCEQFSVHGLKCFHPNPPYPKLGIKLFNHTRALCEASGVAYIMENARSAQQFVGKAVNHCGPFYLWGNSVPPLIPQGISKGTKFGLDKDGGRENRKKFDRYYQTGSKGKGRRDHIANVATISPELAACVADYAERILEQERVTA